MKRLFLAIKIPDQIKDELCELRISTANIHWSPWANYHLTLKYLGDDISPKDEEIIKETLADLNFSSFDLELSTVGIFGKEKNPRIIWCGVTESPELRELQKQCQQILTSLELSGQASQTMKFHPHITLGRPKKLHPDELAEFLQAFMGYKSQTFHVDSFYLMRSLLNNEGAVYTVEHEISLN